MEFRAVFFNAVIPSVQTAQWSERVSSISEVQCAEATKGKIIAKFLPSKKEKVRV